MQCSLQDAFTLGSRIEGLYKVYGIPIRALVHDSNHQCEMWHHRFTHLHYEALPKVRRMASKMPEIQANHDGVCSICAIEKKLK